jgi:transcriptional regulator with XRE-family HTH domain
VIAGLAGISKSHLQRIERGERAPDSLTEILALVELFELARRAAQDRETPMAARAHWMASAAPPRGTAIISCQ